MLHHPETKSRFRYVQKSLFLKLLLCVLIAFLGAKVAIDVSSSDDTAVDHRQTPAIIAAVIQERLKSANLEMVKGPLHEPTDPDRICQAPPFHEDPLSGSATFELSSGTKVELIISDCHPCAWPVKLAEDVSAYVLLNVEINGELSFTMESYIGGSGQNNRGSFSMLLPTHEDQRRQILQIIKQIGEGTPRPNRLEFNMVLNQLLSSTDSHIEESAVLRLGTLLCKCVDVSLITY